MDLSELAKEYTEACEDLQRYKEQVKYGVDRYHNSHNRLTRWIHNPMSEPDIDLNDIGEQIVWYHEKYTNHINECCDELDIKAMTKRINGGYNGLQERTENWVRNIAILKG